MSISGTNRTNPLRGSGEKKQSCTPDGVDQRVLLRRGVVQQGGEQGGVGGLAVEAAAQLWMSAQLTRSVQEERLRAGEGQLPGTTRLQRPGGGRGGQMEKTEGTTDKYEEQNREAEEKNRRKTQN